MEPATEALIRRYYASFNERRVDDAAALFAPDARVEHPPFEPSARGGAAYRQFAETWLRAFPDALLAVQHVEQRDDTICEVDLISAGTHTGGLDMGAYGLFKPSGAKVTLRLRELLEFRTGQITYSIRSFGIHDLIHQLANIDYPQLIAHLDRIQQLHEELAHPAGDATHRHDVMQRLGRELDEARLIVRPWFRR